MRERCLTRVQYIPSLEPSARPLRTDAYQAPYFFPSPMSPEAATYIQEVINERQGTNLFSIMNSPVVQSNPLDALPDPSTTCVNREPERVARPTLSSSRPPSPTPSLQALRPQHGPNFAEQLGLIETTKNVASLHDSQGRSGHLKIPTGRQMRSSWLVGLHRYLRAQHLSPCIHVPAHTPLPHNPRSTRGPRRVVSKPTAF